MQSIITSYLVQSRECSLANIGTFTISTKPAELDIVHKQILPPIQEIFFTENASQNSTALIKYIAHKKNFSADVAENILNDFCSECRERLDSNETLVFDTIGTLQKKDDGHIVFTQSINPVFLKPVHAERVLHENARHNVLVGDKEISTSLVNEYNVEEQAVKKPTWWIWAAALALIGLGTLAYHFSTTSLHSSAMGNQSHFTIDSTGATHYDPAAN